MRYLLVAILMQLCFGCASPKAPEGGPRDLEPPKIIAEKSTPNALTHFKKQNIEITFDEFVELKDLAKQVVISPPFLKNPDINIRGKKMSIVFHEDEPLKENVTYVMNFGDAIQDFNERNILKNYRYVFSTGAYIDSLTLKGNVIDAKEGKPIENALVMLYTEKRDSVVYENRPFYFASSEKDGTFKIENMRADTFKVFALKDANLNYLYDLESEAVAFLDSLIVINDSINPSLQLEMFTAKPRFNLLEYDAKQYGQVKMKFSEEPKNVILSYSLDSIFFQSELVSDSLLVWYDFPQDTAFSIFLSDNQSYFDTIKVRKLNKSAFVSKSKLGINPYNLDNKKGLYPEDSLILFSSHPISSIDTSKITLSDSVSATLPIQFELDTFNRRKLRISYAYLADSSYYLHLDSAAIIDLYGLSNDTLDFSFSINTLDKYATLQLDPKNPDSLFSYQINILDNSKIIKSFPFDQSKTTIPPFTLDVKKYTLEVIEDANRNGKWDSGNYLKKQKPERYYSKKIENLKENWELVEEIDFGSIFKKEKQ